MYRNSLVKSFEMALEQGGKLLRRKYSLLCNKKSSKYFKF
jgi:hypothetical protein